LSNGTAYVSRPVPGGLCIDPSGALQDGHRDTTRTHRSKAPHTSRSLIHNPDCDSLHSACKFPSSLLGILGLGSSSVVSPVCPSGLHSFNGIRMRQNSAQSDGTEGSNGVGLVYYVDNIFLTTKKCVKRFAQRPSFGFQQIRTTTSRGEGRRSTLFAVHIVRSMIIRTRH
jgi:hypothetical protein